MKDTDIVFILDRSGSMNSMRRNAIQGFNKFVSEQQELEGEARLTLVLFNNTCEIVYSQIPIQDVIPLNEDTYIPDATTAYYDALCVSIEQMKSSNHYEGVIFVVLTDGLENASSRKASDVKKLVVEQRENEGWKFIFLAAGEGAIADAVQKLGIPKDATQVYDSSSSEGFESAYMSSSGSVSDYRTG